MTKTSINPETLKEFRNRLRLSQDRLADLSGVSKKTIARLESGKSSANSNTMKKLTDALRVTPDELSEPMDQNDHAERMRYFGFKTLKADIFENTGLAYQMVEWNYGISTKAQLELAPLFAALLAEGSLTWRRQKLDEAKEAVRELEQADHGHQLFTSAAGRAKMAACEEQSSINNRDILGDDVRIFAEERDVDSDLVDPFTKYLAELAEQTSPEFVRIWPEATGPEDPEAPRDWSTGNLLARPSVSYCIGSAELDWLTGGNKWANLALQRGHVTIRDIPDHLMDDDMTKERIEWLGGRVSKAERDEVRSWREPEPEPSIRKAF